MLIRHPMEFSIAFALALSFGCGSSDAPVFSETEDEDVNTQMSSDSDSGTQTDPDSETTSDTEEPQELGRGGQACWEEIFGQWHPNYGLPDCDEGLSCIGNSEQAWCTKRCEETGSLNQEDTGLENWCCGELTDPCDPQRFWLPQSMSAYCIPRTAGLAEPCDISNRWTGSQVRCEPVCRSGKTIHTQCVAPSPDALLCSLQCDPINGDANCTVEPAFEGGCCREMMGGHWCLPADSCE